MKKRKNLSKNESISPISIEISLVRQEGLEPSTFGSGGQRCPLYEFLFLLSLKSFLFFSGAIWVRKRFQNLPYICTKCAYVQLLYRVILEPRLAMLDRQLPLR